jgi:hypothetical protein
MTSSALSAAAAALAGEMSAMSDARTAAGMLDRWATV